MQWLICHHSDGHQRTCPFVHCPSGRHPSHIVRPNVPLRLVLTSAHRALHNRMHEQGYYHGHTPVTDHAEHR